MKNELMAFALESLLPAGSQVLKETYDAYCNGKDIDIQTKGDNSPASAADREAEYAIRQLISAHYPDHGIWGEEYGTHQLNADYVWVLDPLDGTREFLNKKPHHFGLLVGLFHAGKPIFGLVHDPLNGQTWHSRTITETQQNLKNTIVSAHISCTCRTMFESLDNEDKILNMLDKCRIESSDLNCIGFAKVADGAIDAAVENDLSLHDIAAVLPILHAAGAKVVDFAGVDYKDYNFNFNDYGHRNYSIITSLNHDLVDKILEEIQ